MKRNGVLRTHIRMFTQSDRDTFQSFRDQSDPVGHNHVKTRFCLQLRNKLGLAIQPCSCRQLCYKKKGAVKPKAYLGIVRNVV